MSHIWMGQVTGIVVLDCCAPSFVTVLTHDRLLFDANRSLLSDDNRALYRALLIENRALYRVRTRLIWAMSF